MKGIHNILLAKSIIFLPMCGRVQPINIESAKYYQPTDQGSANGQEYYCSPSARLWLMGGVILFARCSWIQLTDILKPSKYYSARCSRVG
jgi:hypothetical protein